MKETALGAWEVRELREVHLLWLPRKGWLPDGGFNLYRSEPGSAQKTKLNAQPIQTQKLMLDPAKLPMLKGTQAGNTPIAASTRESFAAITIKPSGGTFQQMATEAQTLQAMPGLSPVTIRTRLSQGAAVQSHIQSLKQSALRTTQSRTGNTGGDSTSAPASTPADDTALLRGQVILHALGNWEIATDAALAFADTTAQASHRYTYTLKGIDANGQEQTEPLATLDFTVGSDALPPTPAPMALQSDQGIADLHWDPPTSADMDRLLFAGYHLWRVDAAHPNGVKLNDDPIVLTYQQATDGSLLQALTSYRDKNAPLGNVTYRVSLVDAYGRESQPGTFALTMNDLRVPVSVPGVRTILKDEKTACIYWLNSPVDPSDTAPRAYTLYRRDGEIKPAAAPVRIGDALKYSEGGSASLVEQMPLGVMIDLFGLEPLRDLLPDPQATKDEKSLESWRSIWGTKTVADLRSSGKLNAKLSELLKGVNAATDATGTANHFWVYGVSAAYTTNKRETVPAEATPLPFPDLTVPATPGGFSAMFSKQAASFGGYDFASKALQFESKSLPRIAARPPVITESYNAQGQKTTYSAASKPMGHAAEQGGTVHLSWQPVSGSQVTYRVYRVIASGMFPANAGTGQIGQIQNLKAFGKVGGSIPMSYYLDYPNAAMLKPTLLAVTGQTAFDDPLPRAHGMNYLYRVQAVTRWGKESSDKSYQKVYIPATLPPSVPQVLTIYTNANGQVELVVKPAPDEEQVTEYRVFRNSASPDQVTLTSVAQPTQVALAAKAAGGVPPAGGLLSQTRPQVAARIGGQSLSPLSALGSAGARFGIKRYTSPAALLGRSLHPTAAVAASGTVKKAVAASGVPTLSAAAIAKLLDIKTTTELKNGTDVIQGTVTQGLTFTDTTGQPGQDYLYRVIAVGRDQVASALSLPLDGKPIKTKANPVQNLHANMVNLTDRTTNEAQMIGSLSWTAPTGGAGSYIIERAKMSAGIADADLPYQPLTTLDSAKGAPFTGYHDTLVRAGRTYRYRITATDDEGFVSDPVTVDLMVPIPGTPAPSPAVIVTHVLTGPMTGVVTGPNGTGLTAPTGIPGGNTGSGGASGGGGLTSPQPVTGTAHFHQAYQLGSAGRFAVRVDAASYTTDAYAIDAQNYYYCRPAEKFLKLKLRVRNVSTQPQTFDYQTITATCVSADGTPGAATKNWKALDTNTLANRTVAPNAELAIEGVLTADAAGSPQAISFGGSSFDLSDPANAIPALDAASEAPATQGTLYPLAFTAGGVTAAAAQGAAGYKVTLTVKNATLGSLTVGPEVFTITVSDEDGDKYTSKSTAGKITLTPGGTTTIDYTFEVPRTIHIQKISFREKDSRVYVITQGAN